jgi:hypothetical protein
MQTICYQRGCAFCENIFELGEHKQIFVIIFMKECKALLAKGQWLKGVQVPENILFVF